MLHTLLLVAFLAAVPRVQAPVAAAPVAAPAATRGGPERARLPHEVPPKLLHEVERVVDADTLWVRREGEILKCRLHSVDTEERVHPGQESSSGSKPSTVFGEQCALWADQLFKGLAKEGEKPKVGLLFAGDKEARDGFGRYLCHVLLPDGTDYNLQLVREGKSPYFNKYGEDEICPQAFRQAQAAAQAAKLGIWDPATNVAKEAGAPSAQRPYAKLLPWWEARALAVESFRALKREKPAAVYHAEDKEGLAQVAKAGTEVEVFGEVASVFAEKNGDETVLLRGADRDHNVRVRIPAGAKVRHASLELAKRGEEFRQNYVFVRSKVADNGRGFELSSDTEARWRQAGPDVAAAAAAPPR